MKGNARKYLSLMLTASMVLGSFGTTAFAADATTAKYISIATAVKEIQDGTGNITVPSTAGALQLSASATTQGAIFVEPTTLTIKEDSSYTAIDFNTEGTSTVNTTNGAMKIDFKDADITVQATAATVTMSGGTIGKLSFEQAQANFLRNAVVKAATTGNSVTVTGGEVKTDITGASTVTVDNGATVTGKIEATESVEVKGGTVGSVNTKTATISGGTVNNTVTASGDVTVGGNATVTGKIEATGADSKIIVKDTATTGTVEATTGTVEVAGGTVTNVTAPTVTVAGGTVTTVTGKDITVNSGTVTDIVVNDSEAKVTVNDGATVSKIEVALGTTVDSLEVTIPAGSGITVPTEATKVVEKDATSGEEKVTKIAAKFYKNNSDDTPVEKTFNVTNGEITLSATEISGLTVEKWYFNNGTAMVEAPLGQFKVDPTYTAPLEFYAENGGVTPPPGPVEKTVQFAYYGGTVTTTSGAIGIKLSVDADGNMKFPTYKTVMDEQNAVTANSASIPKEADGTTDQTFVGWIIQGTNNPTDADIFAAETTFTNDGVVYEPIFKSAADLKTFTATFKYFKTTDTTAPTGTKVISFKEGETVPNFPAYTGTLGSDFKPLETDQIFEGWVTTGNAKVYTTTDAIPKLDVTYTPQIKTDGGVTPEPPAGTISVEMYRLKGDTTSTVDPQNIKFELKDGKKVFKAPANPGFSYSGKSFDSWETNFDKNYYYPGKDIAVDESINTVKLYAYWTSKSSSSGGGGGGSSSSSTKYTVTASAGKGGSISPSGDVQVTKGNDKTFKITADKGYVISDVLVDGDSVGAVKSYTIKNIKNDMTIKAVFETEDGKPAEEDPENPSENPNENKGAFTDTRGHWAENYINTVVEKGLFSGMTDTTFGPDVAMTRAMFVTVLGRMSNVNTTSYSSSKFSDVPADSWFGPYVNWAAQQGIVSGLTSTTFGPNDPITREQMAVILVNYAKVAGVVLPTVNDPMMFSDNSNISGWAKDAVATAQKAGLINGRTNGSFDPQGKATRAEVATVFVQLDSLAGGSKSAAADTAAEETETTETEETTEE